jgi:ATP-dependent DNA helicase RecG
MADFRVRRDPVLVATTAIEVGVDVPNATIMVIERAEHFGLAQLHQLRGRVGRGEAASTCLLMYQPPLTESAERRLSVLRETEDGFRIAEEDLAMRGAGDLIGTAQSGLPKFRVADLEAQAGLMAGQHATGDSPCSLVSPISSSPPARRLCPTQLVSLPLPQ